MPAGPSTKNSDYGMGVGKGFFISFGEGNQLAQSSGVIVVTDSAHTLTGTGTITTINFKGTKPSTRLIVFFQRASGATCIFGAGGNIVGPIPTINDLSPVLALWDGAANWSLMSITGSAATVASILLNGVLLTAGTGDPEGAVVGNVGDLRLRTDGPGSDLRLYGKDSGAATNTGWKAYAFVNASGHTGSGKTVLQSAATLIDALLNSSATLTGTSPVLQGERDSAGVTELVLGIANGANEFQTGTAAGDIALINRAGGKLFFSTDPASTAAAYISSGQQFFFSKGIRVQGSYIFAGTGSPEGVVTASPGDVFLRQDGGVDTSFYYKATGSGTNTGWKTWANFTDGATGGLQTAAGNGETITTSARGIARYTTNGAARTGVIMQAPTSAGQIVNVSNEDPTAVNTITMAAKATSNVASGVACVINGGTGRRFFSPDGVLWYEE